MGKAAVLPVITDHLATLRRDPTQRFSVRDLGWHYGMPAVLAAAVVVPGARLVDASQIIAGAAVLSGFAFGLAVFVFELRMSVARDPRLEKGDFIFELLDELFRNVNYLVLSGIVLTSMATAAVSIDWSPSSVASDGSLSAAWTAVLLWMCTHFVLTIFMCVKRLRRAYGELSA